MNYILRTIIIIIAIALFCVPSSRAAVIRADSYADGLNAVKNKNAVLVVLVHGSDWNIWGERVNDGIFKSKTFEKSLPNGTIVFADVDILQTPSEEQKKKNDERNKLWKSKGVYTYPAICGYSPDGTLLGTRQGKNMPRDIDKAGKAVANLVELCLTYNKLKEQADKAKAAKDINAELKALGAMGMLGLTRSAGILDRIKDLDPKDTSGHHARLSFPHWNKLLVNSTNRTKKGEGEKVQAELNKMLKNHVYTQEQTALIYVALGSSHRQQKDHEKQAAEAFMKAWQMAPESFAGQIGKRSYEAWYKK